MRKLYALFSIVVIVVFFTGFSNAQNNVAVGVQAGVALPLDDFGDIYDAGFGGQGTFAIRVSPNVDVTGSVGYLTWSGKDLDYTFSTIPILAGIRYYFREEKFNPYITGELGIHFTTVDVPTLIVRGLTISGISASDSFFGFGLGAGFLYQLSPKLNLDVNSKFSSISSSGGSSNYISIMAGLLVSL